MKSSSHVMSRTASSSQVFDVHRPGSRIDNRGVAGRSASIVKRSGGGGGAAAFAIVLAAIAGAVALARLVRTFSTQRGGAISSDRLSALRTAIVGVQKQQIAAILGRPRATIGRGNYLSDDTWYYPIDPRHHLALAIQFDHDVAKQTQVIRGACTGPLRRA
jgi:hypothetical protein